MKDEHYIIDLCDKILGYKSKRQHRFNFLLGDPNKKGICRKLPVDAFYEELNLVIEYKERQHTESVNHFDKPNKITLSGVHRGIQRKIYDERRRIVLPENNINLIEIDYSSFDHFRSKKLKRNIDQDTLQLISILKEYLQK